MSAGFEVPAASAPANWRGADLVRDESWIHRFAPAQLAELDAALRHFQATGKPLDAMAAEDFPLPTLAPVLARQLREIKQGRGFVVLRGVKVPDYTDEEVGTMFYGLGLHLGRPLYQNPQGDLLGHVFDQGRKFGELNVRGYMTNAFLSFHTDSCEIVGLMCLRKAKSGGFSSLASAVAVYDEIARTRPALLAPLQRGFHYIRREAAFSDRPVTERPLPVFGIAEGLISCRCVPNQIEAGHKHMGKPLEGLDREALDAFLAVSAADGVRLDMDLEVGDMQLCNNYTILHSRTGFEDWPEPERRRHMLRLWLGFRDGARPLPAGFPRQVGYPKGGMMDAGMVDVGSGPSLATAG